MRPYKRIASGQLPDLGSSALTLVNAHPVLRCLGGFEQHRQAAQHGDVHDHGAGQSNEAGFHVWLLGAQTAGWAETVVAVVSDCLACVAFGAVEKSAATPPNRARLTSSVAARLVKRDWVVRDWIAVISGSFGVALRWCVQRGLSMESLSSLGALKS
jgi:hypothetical protein